MLGINPIQLCHHLCIRMLATVPSPACVTWLPLTPQPFGFPHLSSLLFGTTSPSHETFRFLVADLDMETTHSTCTSDAMVDNLPPEVRHELLTTLDLSSLRNVVHASPVFYRQYFLERRSILSLCLERTLGRTVLDAYWVYQTARSSKFPSITNDETISNFRQAYMHQRASGSYSILRKSVTENLAVGIAAFHYSTVDPIMQLYIRHVLEVLDEQTGGIVGQEPLSQVEQARLIRGLYRFQLCCNLFTMANFPESSTLSSNGRTMRILTDYISLLEPWEIEEMGCIYSFANERFERVFEAVWRCTAGDGAKTRPRKVPDPEDGYDLGDTGMLVPSSASKKTSC